MVIISFSIGEGVNTVPSSGIVSTLGVQYIFTVLKEKQNLSFSNCSYNRSQETT